MTSSTSDTSITAGDVAGVILRAALAGTMIAHGVRHARTLEGTAGWFGSVGFDKPELQAKASAVVEIGSGAALALGLATPLSASAVVGTMSVAYVSVHRPNGYFVIKEGWEYVGFISAASLAASALGGGRLSIDRLLGLHAAGHAVDARGRHRRRRCGRRRGPVGAVLAQPSARLAPGDLGVQAPGPHIAPFGEHVADVSSASGNRLSAACVRAGTPVPGSVSRTGPRAPAGRDG